MRYVIDVVDWRVIQTVFGKEQVSQTFVLRKVGKPDNFAREVWAKYAISWEKGRLNIPIYFGKIIHTKQLSYRDIYMLGYVYTQSQSLLENVDYTSEHSFTHAFKYFFPLSLRF